MRINEYDKGICRTCLNLPIRLKNKCIEKVTDLRIVQASLDISLKGLACHRFEKRVLNMGISSLAARTLGPMCPSDGAVVLPGKSPILEDIQPSRQSSIYFI